MRTRRMTRLDCLCGVCAEILRKSKVVDEFSVQFSCDAFLPTANNSQEEYAWMHDMMMCCCSFLIFFSNFLQLCSLFPRSCKQLRRTCFSFISFFLSFLPRRFPSSLLNFFVPTHSQNTIIFQSFPFPALPSIIIFEVAGGRLILTFTYTYGRVMHKMWVLEIFACSSVNLWRSASKLSQLRTMICKVLAPNVVVVPIAGFLDHIWGNASIYSCSI